MNKRGLDAVVVTAILVLLTIAAIALIWSFLRPVIDKPLEDLENTDIGRPLRGADLSPEQDDSRFISCENCGEMSRVCDREECESIQGCFFEDTIGFGGDCIGEIVLLDDNISLSPFCNLTRAYWNDDGETYENELVELVVEGESCDNEELIIEIYEEDLLFNNLTELINNSMVFIDGEYFGEWQSVWECDGESFGICTAGNPEYFFYARLKSELNRKIKSDSPLLTVKKANVLCGDGLRQEPEQCDDGNTASGDGCSNSCLIEQCGNNIKDLGETCDGDRIFWDCDSSPGSYFGYQECKDDCSGYGQCVVTHSCGDGVLQQQYEECDDGNRDNNDGCSSSCDIEKCGDLICQASEDCSTCQDDCGTISCFRDFCGQCPRMPPDPRP